MNDERQAWLIANQPTSATNTNSLLQRHTDSPHLMHKKTWAAPKRPARQSSATMGHRSDTLSIPRASSARHHQQYRSSMAVNLGTPDDVRGHHNHLAGGSSLNTIAVVDRRESTGGLSTAATAADLHFQSTGMMSYRHPYSSSQAQLQSLTGPALHNDTLRKTPNKQRVQQHPPQEYRSQLSLASTKPMMTSVLNEPSPFAATMSRQLTAANARPSPMASATTTSAPHPVHTTTINGSSQPLPPPYSVDNNAAMLQHQQQQSIGPGIVSALHPSNVQQPHQHVICRQPQPSQFQCNVDGSNSQPPPQMAGGSGGGGIRANPATSSSTSFPVIPQSASQQQQLQQHMLSYLGNQVPSASVNFPSIGQHQQYPTFLHHHHPHHQPHHSSASEPVTAVSGSCQQQQHHHHQQQQSHPAIVGISKSKSCLTCADISIKWYIVVIALLGLICALIGTIVGAVHSAGRDYISLALLLIGVGLVLVAISWIALRITIKTYKGGQAGRSPTPHPPPLRPAHMTRLFGQGAHPAAAAANSSLHRSLLNERLYMMAAAAAAMSRQSGGATPNQPTQDHPQPSGSSQRPAGDESSSPSVTGLMAKLRLPRRLARLIPYRSLGEFPGAAQGPAGGRRSELPTANSFTPDHPLLSGSTAANPSALAAAHAILQQFQAAQHPGAFLFPPGAPFFGFPAGADHSFRPPPPSYSASMQDHRLRMLLQERAGLQQMNSMIPSAHPPPPPPPSSLQQPVPLQSSQSSQTQATGNELGFSGHSNPPQARGPHQQQQQSSTVVIESAGSGGQGPPSQYKERAPSADETPPEAGSSGRLKPSSSAPSIGALVTNDIYVTSEDCTLQRQRPSERRQRANRSHEPAPGSGHNSTIVNIGSSSTTVECQVAGGESRVREQQQQKQSSSNRKSEAKFLGYL